MFAPSHIARKGECEGETFAGFPTRVQSPARRRPILRSKIAAPKKTTTQRVVVFFGAGDEESAEAPPAAEEARRFRGSVPTASRGSGWEPADTTVSAEEHAKKITTQMGGDLCDCPQVLLCLQSAVCSCEPKIFFRSSPKISSNGAEQLLLYSSAKICLNYCGNLLDRITRPHKGRAIYSNS